jgi:hypothetical protein
MVVRCCARALLSSGPCVCLLAFSIAALAQSTIEGRWHGLGAQRSIPAGFDLEYTVCIALDGESGTIDYPSLACGGSLTRLSRDQTGTVFRERITYGNCVDGGEVTVDLVKDKLSFTWLGTHKHISLSVVALLNRVGGHPAGSHATECARREVSDARSVSTASHMLAPGRVGLRAPVAHREMAEGTKAR